MVARVTLDEIDRQILALLERDARRTVADISQHVALSQAPIKRRIDRMERAGIIAGYTTVVDYGKLGSSIQAFVEVRLNGDADADEVIDAFQAVPEIQATFTIAGDTDAMVMIRVEDVEHLRQIVNHLRRIGDVRGTKTLMVLEAWSRART
jgi:Lrp/AsnC family leucine-responsive transcriptional regulator